MQDFFWKYCFFFSTIRAAGENAPKGRRIGQDSCAGREKGPEKIGSRLQNPFFYYIVTYMTVSAGARKKPRQPEGREDTGYVDCRQLEGL